MQHFIATYGYAAVFLLMVAESACIPVPSELIMTLGGALAAGAVAGTHLNLAGVIVAGVVGNVVGSYIAWAVGRYAGMPALRRWGHRVWLREHDLDRAEVWFNRHGPKAVLVGRILPVVRTFISLPAGAGGMAPGRFGIYTTLGCIPWSAALAVVGYEVGANYQSIVNGFHGPTDIIAVIVVIAIVVALVVYARRRRAGLGGGEGQHRAGGRHAGPAGAAGRSARASAPSGPARSPGSVSPADPADPAGPAVGKVR
jgi:membrane protein DedA with SNARE-associated domain